MDLRAEETWKGETKIKKDRYLKTIMAMIIIITVSFVLSCSIPGRGDPPLSEGAYKGFCEVERLIHFRSTPSGAKVYVEWGGNQFDEIFVGTTPVSYKFKATYSQYTPCHRYPDYNTCGSECGIDLGRKIRENSWMKVTVELNGVIKKKAVKCIFTEDEGYQVGEPRVWRDGSIGKWEVDWRWPPKTISIDYDHYLSKKQIQDSKIKVATQPLSTIPSHPTEPLEKEDTVVERPYHAKEFGQRWGLVVGVSEYQDTRIPSLRYSSSDAQSFYDWLISPEGGRYAPARVKLLLDQDATGKNIKKALFTWLKQPIEEDVVIIYFAGHGSPDTPDTPKNLFLLPYDAKYNEIATTGFPMWDIETALKRFIKAKKVVVIADACHAAGVGQSFDIARRTNRAIAVNPISSGLQNLTQIGDGVCVISATDEKQFSQESKDWGGGHGVFTYFLLKGLKGKADYTKDGKVTLGELLPYISEKVRRETKNLQYPTVAGKYDPSLTIGK